MPIGRMLTGLIESPHRLNIGHIPPNHPQAVRCRCLADLSGSFN
jgi:hypothetical protein